MNIIIAIIVFSLLIITHELGHFLMARAVGVEVVEFSVGFGPKIIGREHNGTLYCWRIIPFGGYCALVGENEENDSDNSFSAKPPWARMLVLLGGPLFNFITAIILSMLIVIFGGANVPRVSYVYSGYGAEAAGIQAGDVIRSFDGERIGLGKDIELYLLTHELDGRKIEIEYERDGQPATALVDTTYQTYLVGITYTANEEPAVISSVNEGYPAEQAGMRKGDVVTSVNGTSISTGADLRKFFADNKVNGSEITFTVERGGERAEIAVTPQSYTGYYLGFEAGVNHEKVGLLGVIKNTFLEFGYWIRYVFTSLRMIFTGRVGFSDVSGPVGIVVLIGSTVEESSSDGLLYVVLNLMTIASLLSANLGVFNLLPLPALDGGQLLIAIIEWITRRKLPEQGKGLINNIGLTFWMVVMMFIIFSDIWKLVQ